MTSLVLTVTETLRYQGKLGQWSWVAHRVAGLATLLFVVMHVIDTSWATFYPDLYEKAIAAYRTPLFTIGEFALVAGVVYHALNGFRIAIIDWRPKWWRHQANAAKIVWLVSIAILIPVFLAMFGHVLNFYNARTSGFDLGLEQTIEAVAPFAFGTVVVLGLALIVSGVTTFIPSINPPIEGTKKVYRKSRLDTFMWAFMRISGVMIIPLVFGHLAMVHVIQGVFDITLAGHTPVGTNLGANLVIMKDGFASASNFVALRWNTMFAGVFIWRIYDCLLLILISIHGFYGLRYVINDYASNRLVNRALWVAALGTAIGLIIVGSLAIINTVPATTEQMLKDKTSTSSQTSQVIPAQNQGSAGK